AQPRPAGRGARAGGVAGAAAAPAGRARREPRRRRARLGARIRRFVAQDPARPGREHARRPRALGDAATPIGGAAARRTVVTPAPERDREVKLALWGGLQPLPRRQTAAAVLNAG